jgi:DNA-binding MarR family transcriptional regulator
VTAEDRARFVAQLARELGTTPADVEANLREAVAAGFVETPDGWQATLPPTSEGTRR